MESELKYKTFSALMHGLYAELTKHAGETRRRPIRVTGAIHDQEVLLQAQVSLQVPPDVFILADEDESSLEA